MSPEHREEGDVPPLGEGHLAFLAAVRSLRVAERSADLDAVRTLLGARELDALRDDLVAANLLRIAPHDPTRRSQKPPAYFLTPAGVAALDRGPGARRER